MYIIIRRDTYTKRYDVIELCREVEDAKIIVATFNQLIKERNLKNHIESDIEYDYMYVPEL
jgi:hypothetical protein